MKQNKKKDAHSANTEDIPGQLKLQGLETVKHKKTIVRNDGGTDSFDAELLLLQQVEQKHRIIENLQDALPINKHQRPFYHSYKFQLVLV